MINKFGDSTYDEQVEVDYSGSPLTKAKQWKAAATEGTPHAQMGYDEASHPAYPNAAKKVKSKCPMGFSSSMLGAKKKETIDWHSKYMEAQRDLAEESARWNKRFKDLELAYSERIQKIRDEYEDALEEGYQEAYEMLVQERNKVTTLEDALQQELAAVEKTAHEGYNQAYNIIQDLQKKNAELQQQLAKPDTKDDVVLADQEFMQKLKEM